jgi:hypothetical protein
MFPRRRQPGATECRCSWVAQGKRRRGRGSRRRGRMEAA